MIRKARQKTPKALSRVTQRSFTKSLILGNIEEDLLFPFPQTSEEQIEKQNEVKSILNRLKPSINTTEFDQQEKFPSGYIEKLSSLGLMGLPIPEDFGGFGLSNSSYLKIIEEVSQLDGSTVVTMAAHQSIGFRALSLFGTEAQKKKFFPRLATGELIGCFALTEPEAGSDVGSLRTTATLTPDGKHYSITGEKIWITNAGFANYITVFARTTDQADPKKSAPSAFIVELPSSGVRFGEPEKKMGLKASKTASIYFDQVLVPIENVLGEIGKGFKIAMSVLNHGRLGLGAGSLGVMKKVFLMASSQAALRRQFGKNINEFGLIQKKLGQMQVDIFVVEAMLDWAAPASENAVIDFSVEAAIIKVFASERMWIHANEALQIFGGMGYMREAHIEQVIRDIRANLIFEGTNEIGKLFIALQSLDSISKQFKALSSTLNPFDFSSQLLRILKRNILGANLKSAHPELKPLVQRYLSLLQKTSLKLIKYSVKLPRGKHQLKEIFTSRQLELECIAELVSIMFAGAAVLSKASSLLWQARKRDQCELNSILSLFFLDAEERVELKLKQLAKAKEVAHLYRFLKSSNNVEDSADAIRNTLNDAVL